jgi:dihydrofolate reductase
MGQIVANTFVTLDGVMQAPGGPDEDRSGGFAHGGWSVPFWSDDMHPVLASGFARMGAILLGRGTYDIFAAHWPKITDEQDPSASLLNNATKYVVSDTLERADWRGTTIVRGRELDGALARMRDEHAGEIQVHGSPGLLRTLLARDLVDELRLLVFPLVLGTGKRLFAEGAAPARLSLAETQRFERGVVLLRYQRVGVPSYGSFAIDAEKAAAGAP